MPFIYIRNGNLIVYMLNVNDGANSKKNRPTMWEMQRSLQTTLERAKAGAPEILSWRGHDCCCLGSTHADLVLSGLGQINSLLD
jgi:hypothetical protein